MTNIAQITAGVELPKLQQPGLFELSTWRHLSPVSSSEAAFGSWGLAGGQHQAHRQAVLIDDGVDLGA